MACEDQTDNKSRIISALKSAGEHKLAECIEQGRVHVGGCMPINERVNDALEHIMNKAFEYNIKDGRGIRMLNKRFNLALKAGRSAHVRYDSCNREFHNGLQFAMEAADDDLDMPRRR